MQEKSKFSVLILFTLLIVFVVLSSYFIAPLWGEKVENRAEEITLTVTANMTIDQIIQNNNLDEQLVSKALKVDVIEVANKTLLSLGIAEEEATKKLDKALALKIEEESKNWFKIPLKLGLWAIWLVTAFVMLKKNKITSQTRKYLLFAAIIIFGVIFGTEPNPMSTVKDNIVTLTSNGMVFPPRLVVMLLFLVTIFLANKLICAWGCQLGTLQDLIFRINRNQADTKGIIFQYKVPFVISNSLRILFFVGFLTILMAWTIDILEIVNPFKVYNPAALTATGIIFSAIIFIASLFIYRPWCHFFCPLGLLGWLLEKISLNRITVNRNSCISCEKCVKACPTNVMDSILKQAKTIPDCFSCATCINVCPTKSISFAKSKIVNAAKKNDKTLTQ